MLSLARLLLDNNELSGTELLLIGCVRPIFGCGDILSAAVLVADSAAVCVPSNACMCSVLHQAAQHHSPCCQHYCHSSTLSFTYSLAATYPLANVAATLMTSIYLLHCRHHTSRFGQHPSP
jgi:hypothetical protein